MIRGDVTPPITSANFQVRPDGAVVIDFSSTDGNKISILDTFFRLDAGVQSDALQLVITDPGTHLLEYWSVDQAGNVEAANAKPLVVGSVEPVLLESSLASHSTIRQAYDSIPQAGSDVIIVKGSYLPTESLVLGRSISVLLDGGYDEAFANTTASTPLNSPLTVKSGQVTVSNIIIK